MNFKTGTYYFISNNTFNEKSIIKILDVGDRFKFYRIKTLTGFRKLGRANYGNDIDSLVSTYGYKIKELGTDNNQFPEYFL